MTSVFKCDTCGKGLPCIIIVCDSIDLPEFCPWSGSKTGCDWNYMKAVEL